MVHESDWVIGASVTTAPPGYLTEDQTIAPVGVDVSRGGLGRTERRASFGKACRVGILAFWLTAQLEQTVRRGVGVGLVRLELS